MAGFASCAPHGSNLTSLVVMPLAIIYRLNRISTGDDMSMPTKKEHHMTFRLRRQARALRGRLRCDRGPDDRHGHGGDPGPRERGHPAGPALRGPARAQHRAVGLHLRRRTRRRAAAWTLSSRCCRRPASTCSATAAARTPTTTTGRPTPTSRPASGVTRSGASPAPPSPTTRRRRSPGQLRQHRLAALRPVLRPGQGDRRAELRDGELRLGHARRGGRLGQPGQHGRPAWRCGRSATRTTAAGRSTTGSPRPPENFQGYKPNTYTSVNGVSENATCPQMTQGNAAGTQTLATSYAVNARTSWLR